MATTKTLTPTNQAITLAAFTEKPDNRTNVTNDDKLADAVNALNSNIADISHLHQYVKTSTSQASSFTFETSDDRYVALVFIVDNNMAGKGSLYVVISKKGVTASATKIAGNGDNVSVAYSTGTITVSLSSWSFALVLTTAIMT